MPTPVHIHAGDCAAEVARAADLPGEVIPWRDSAAVGPCARERARHLFLRAAWWQIDPDELQRSEELPGDRERVLWFGPDPWEQMQLVEVLAHLSEGPCSIAPLTRGVGELTADALAPAFAARQPAESLRPFMAALWFDYCDNDREALAARADRLDGDPRLPHMSAALRRILEDRCDRRTEREVERLVKSGVRDVPALMDALRQREQPTHGAWYGDVVVRRLRDSVLLTGA